MTYCTENKQGCLLDEPLSDQLNDHEYTNACRSIAAKRNKPACVEQQTNAEWLADYDAEEAGTNDN